MLIIYRSYGGENMKHRPAYYSKLVCLKSFLRAAAAVPDARLVFMNDGPIPADRLELMRAHGEVVTLPSVGMRRSYVAGLRFAWHYPAGSAGEVVWFSEDDYLYAPDALVALADAATHTSADYFALYGSTAGHWLSEDDENCGWTPQGWEEFGPVEIGSHRWTRAVSTASSFGARRGALRQDRHIFLQGLLPHIHRYRDHDTCVVYQGYRPHEWGALAREALLLTEGGWNAKARAAAIAPFKAALNLRSRRRPRNRRLLIAPFPNLACHVEEGQIPEGIDWATVAEEARAWGADPSVPALSPSNTS